MSATEIIVQHTHAEKFQSILFKMLLFDGLVKVLEIAVVHDVASIRRAVMVWTTLLHFQFGTSDSMRVGCFSKLVPFPVHAHIARMRIVFGIRFMVVDALI